MNFKKPKQEVINDAYNAANGMIYSAFENVKYGYVQNTNSSNIDALRHGITEGIRMAIQSLVENTYTDQEFEEDMGLKDKG